MSAYRDGDTVVVLMPAGLSRAAEQRHVNDLLARIARREARSQPSDEGLARRADRLRVRYLPEVPSPASVRFVHNQRKRWGSCTPADQTIRLSARLTQMPGWVLDYVLVHELAHLVEAGHGPAFERLVRRYPHHDKAVGYLLGYAAAEGDPSGRPVTPAGARPPGLD